MACCRNTSSLPSVAPSSDIPFTLIVLRVKVARHTDRVPIADAEEVAIFAVEEELGAESVGIALRCAFDFVRCAGGVSVVSDAPHVTTPGVSVDCGASYINRDASMSFEDGKEGMGGEEGGEKENREEERKESAERGRDG